MSGARALLVRTSRGATTKNLFAPSHPASRSENTLSRTEAPLKDAGIQKKYAT